jgi:hypothetical protein
VSFGSVSINFPFHSISLNTNARFVSKRVAHKGNFERVRTAPGVARARERLPMGKQNDETRKTDVDDVGDGRARKTRRALPQTIVLKETTDGSSAHAEVWDHFSVLAWIASDCCWTVETKWTMLPLTLVILFFSHNAWVVRKHPAEFRHALAVFFWLACGDGPWAVQDFYGSTPFLEVWCVIAFSVAIVIELVQMTVCYTGDMADVFQALAILSWAAHDLVVYSYYALPAGGREASLVVWWVLSVIILLQVLMYLILQYKDLQKNPSTSGFDYALALFAWSFACIYREFGNYYFPKSQTFSGVFVYPDDPLNMRWFSFWITVVGSLPLAMWCVRHVRRLFRATIKDD